MLTQAYLTACWQRVKKMPSLKKVLEEKKTNPAEAKTPEQMLGFAMYLQQIFEREED